MSWGLIGGAAVTVIGGAVSANNGKKAPAAAPYTPVDPQAAQTAAIQGNIANQGDIEQLLTRTNNYQQGQANSLMEQAVPGYGALSSTLMGQAQKEAANPYAVPQDVQDNLTRLAAEHGVSRGTNGQTNQYSLLRDLGVNELQYGQSNIQQSLSALQTLTGVAPKVSAASPLSFYLTPAQSIATQTNNNTQQQAVAQGANNAQTTANNTNNANLWSSVLKGAGQLSQVNWAGQNTGVDDGSPGGVG